MEAVTESEMPARGLPVPVGDRYQARVPEQIERDSRDKDKLGRDVGGAVRWIPNRVRPEELQAYLVFGQHLFQQAQGQAQNGADGEEDFPVRFCEARGLYFLHQCNYDVHQAMDMLRPVAPEEKDPQEEEEETDGDDYCFMCGDGGNLILCDAESCQKAYHQACLGYTEVPGGTWHCPRHFCVVCNKRLGAHTLTTCLNCPTSYCSEHVPAALKDTEEAEFFCAKCVSSANSGAILGRKGFLKRLVALLDRQGTPLMKVPWVGGKELDLYQLYKEVIKRGGLSKVVESDAFSKIKNELGLPEGGTQHANTSYLLKMQYTNWLYQYEKHFFPGHVPLESLERGRGKKRQRDAAESSPTEGVADMQDD